MAVNVEQDVFRLDVSVDDVFVVQVFQSQKDLAKVESRCVFIEHRVKVDVEEELSSRAKFNQQVEVVSRFKRTEGFANKRMVKHIHCQTLLDFHSLKVLHIFYHIFPYGL